MLRQLGRALKEGWNRTVSINSRGGRDEAVDWLLGVIADQLEIALGNIRRPARNCNYGGQRENRQEASHCGFLEEEAAHYNLPF